MTEIRKLLNAIDFYPEFSWIEHGDNWLCFRGSRVPIFSFRDAERLHLLYVSPFIGSAVTDARQSTSSLYYYDFQVASLPAALHNRMNWHGDGIMNNVVKCLADIILANF